MIQVGSIRSKYAEVPENRKYALRATVSRKREENESDKILLTDGRKERWSYSERFEKSLRVEWSHYCYVQEVPAIIFFGHVAIETLILLPYLHNI